MIWYDHMFLGTGCQSKLKMLKHRISRQAPHAGVYLITLPTQEDTVLEIIPSALLLQEHYPTEDLRIVGMAFTRTEALCLIEKILSESFRTRGDVDIEAFMKDYNKNQRKDTA